MADKSKRFDKEEMAALISRFRNPQGTSETAEIINPVVTAGESAGNVSTIRTVETGGTYAQQGSTAATAARCSFADLPSYRQLKVQLRVAAATGIKPPYFMVHQGLAKDSTVLSDGRTVLNFSSYDYIGLNGDPRLTAAVTEAAARYGTSASASRLVAGERPLHRQLEQALATHYGTADCLALVSGYATNVTTIATLFGSHDVIFADKLSHNSIMTGAQDSGAARIIYPHNDIQALRQLLQLRRARYQRALIVTEGVFSMDGNIAALPELVALKREFGCFLMVDEAHALGCIGQGGQGSRAYHHLAAADVDIWMGTLSKTLCGCGGFIAGSSELVELLKYKASAFVYSVGLSPVLTAASLKALQLMHEESWRTEKLQDNGLFALHKARELGLNTGLAEGTAILPVITGSSMKAAFLSNLLLEAGVCALPIIYPVVSEGAARLRFFLSASHSREQIARALELTASLMSQAAEREAKFIANTRAHAQDGEQGHEREQEQFQEPDDAENTGRPC